MQEITPTHPRPGTPLRRSGHATTLWTGVVALAATATLGIAAPRFTVHAHAASGTVARSAAAAQPAAGGSSGTVPAASEVFVNPGNSALTAPQVPTF